MTRSPLAALDIPADDRWTPRRYKISGFTIHHNAGVDSYLSARGSSRGTSANYWITNDGRIVSQVDE